MHVGGQERGHHERGPSIALLADMLAAKAEAFCKDFLPGGVKEGSRWRAGDVFGDRGQSVSVIISGPRQGQWKDFSADDLRGDLIDLICANRRCDKKEAYKIAMDWLGISERTFKPSDARHAEARLKAKVTRQTSAIAEENEKKSRWSRLMFRESKAGDGTIVVAYLRGRAITLPVPAAIRLKPMCEHKPSGRTLPCMVAAIYAPVVDKPSPYEIVAVHRTWLIVEALERRAAAGVYTLDHHVLDLGVDGGGKVTRYKWTPPGQKRDQGKMVLGPATGGFIPLTPWPTRATLALAEGIETGLSVAQVNPDWSVWATISVSNMRNIVIPAGVRRLVLCADGDSKAAKDASGEIRRDAAGQPIVPAEEAVKRAAQLHADVAADAGRLLHVEIVRPEPGMDFNDMLQRGLL
jgi:hypothetical protein